MRVAVLLLALAMLVTGSINTVSVKFQDMVVVGHAADGSPLHFKHPVVQAAFMFFGESLCLIPYFLLRWHKWSRRAAGLDPPSKRPKQPRGFFIKRALMFSIPALCDSMASVLLNLGLFYTNASTYQMLRGTLVLFAGTFTVLLLRRRLFLHHWIGMILITAGAMIVGAASILYSASRSPPPAPPSPALLWTLGQLEEQGAGPGGFGAAARPLAAVWASASGLFASLGGQLRRALGQLREEGASDALLGDILVVVAQAFSALQFIVEEKLLGTFKMQPLVAVGLEGMWGMVVCLFALPLVPLLHDARGRPLDDLPGALREMAADPRLAGAVALGVLSIGFFNFFGLSVTKALSGASRATIDACRTLFVWIVAMAAGWEAFHNLQVVGFLVLVAGTSLYNEILRSCLPQVYPPRRELRRGGDDDDGSSSCSSVGYQEADDGPDLEAPLLLLESNGAGREQQGSGQHRPMKIPQHHVEAQHYMARSLTLGVTALSPQPLHYEDTTMPYSVSKLVGDVLNVSPTGSSLNPDSSLMRSRTSCDMDGGSARGSGTALSQYEQRQAAAAAAPADGGVGLRPARPAAPAPPAPTAGSSKSASKAREQPAPTALPAAAEPRQASAVVVVAPVRGSAADLQPEQAAHLTHVYKPGGRLQHALVAAGQVQGQAAQIPSEVATSGLAAVTAAGLTFGGGGVLAAADAGPGAGGVVAAVPAAAGGPSSGPVAAAVAEEAGAGRRGAPGSAGGPSAGAAAEAAAAGAESSPAPSSAGGPSSEAGAARPAAAGDSATAKKAAKQGGGRKKFSKRK